MTSTDLITGFVQVLALCTPNHGIVASLMTQQVNNLPAMQETRDMSLILGSGRSPRGGNGKPFQYSCLGNPVDRGAWWAAAPWGCKELDTTEWRSTAEHRQTPSIFLCPLFRDLSTLWKSYWTKTNTWATVGLDVNWMFSWEIIPPLPAILAISQSTLCLSGRIERSWGWRRKNRSLPPILYIFTYLVHHVKALSKEQLPCISLSLLWSINFESHPSSSVSGLYLLVPSTYIDPRMGQLVGEDLPILPLSSLLGTLFLYPVVKPTTYLAHLEAQTGLILPPRLSGEGDGRETWVLFLCYYPLPKVDVIIIKLEEV